jgi:hypothetical protein
MCIVSTIYADDSFKTQDTLDYIFQHAQTSVEKIEEGKIFLKPERVSLYRGRIYVEGEYGEAIALSSIHSDESGIFILAGEKRPRTTPVWTCRKCTKTHYYEPRTCERCDNTTFIVRFMPKS